MTNFLLLYDLGSAEELSTLLAPSEIASVPNVHGGFSYGVKKLGWFVGNGTQAAGKLETLSTSLKSLVDDTHRVGKVFCLAGQTGASCTGLVFGMKSIARFFITPNIAAKYCYLVGGSMQIIGGGTGIVSSCLSQCAPQWALPCYGVGHSIKKGGDIIVKTGKCMENPLTGVTSLLSPISESLNVDLD